MLIRENMVQKTSGTTALSLTMEAGQSARIKDIRTYCLAEGAEDIMVQINRKSVMQFKAPSTWNLLCETLAGGFIPLLQTARRLGLFLPIPLAEGETLTITGPGAGDYMEVIYDLHDAGDVSADEPNGSKSKQYQLWQMISNSVAPTESGDESLDQSDLDPQFPQFPGGAVVPGNTEMRLLALFGAGVSKGDGTAQDQHTSYLKFLGEREQLFDKDLTGITYFGDVSTVADSTIYHSDFSQLSLPTQYAEAKMIVFDEPIVFRAGEELNVSATIVETTPAEDMAVAAVKLGMLFNVLRL